MEKSQLQILYKTFDENRRENGVEYWYARDLYPLLGYLRWENFETVIDRAKEACENSKSSIGDHFRDVTKMVRKLFLYLDTGVTLLVQLQYGNYKRQNQYNYKQDDSSSY